MLKIGGEVACTYALADFFSGEVAAVGYFFGQCGRGVGLDTIDVDQFALYLALVNVGAHQGSVCGIYAYLLGTLAQQSFGHCLAHGNVSAHGSIPFAGLYVLPIGALLQIQRSVGREYVQVDYGVQPVGVCMALLTCGARERFTTFAHQRQNLVGCVEQRTISVAEETEVVGQGIVVDAVPITTYKGGHEQ